MIGKIEAPIYIVPLICVMEAQFVTFIFLRLSIHLNVGTKVMCCEGGCGCCVVSITRHDLSASKNVTLAVNSVRSCTFIFFSFIKLKRISN